MSYEPHEAHDTDDDLNPDCPCVDELTALRERVAYLEAEAARKPTLTADTADGLITLTVVWDGDRGPFRVDPEVFEGWVDQLNTERRKLAAASLRHREELAGAVIARERALRKLEAMTAEQAQTLAALHKVTTDRDRLSKGHLDLTTLYDDARAEIHRLRGNGAHVREGAMEPPPTDNGWLTVDGVREARR